MKNAEKSAVDTSALYHLTKNNVWIRCKSNTDFRWSDCERLFPQIFVPGRRYWPPDAEPNCEYRTGIGTFSKYGYQITIAWWTGLNSGFSEKSIIEFNPPNAPSWKNYLARLFRLTKRRNRQNAPVCYWVDLISQVDETGKIEYRFEVINSITGEVCDAGVIFPGYISTRLNSAQEERILKAI